MAYGIAAPFKRKGLFGQIGEYRGPSAPAPETGNQAPQQVAQPEAQPEPKKPGFFDKGGASQYVFAGLQDFLQRRMGEQPTGVTSLLQRQQAEQQAAAQAAAAQLERAQELADWQFKKQYEWQNAPEPNNDTVNDFEWYKGLSPEDREIYHRMKPQYMTVDNGDGTKSIVPIGPNGPVMGGAPQSKPYDPNEWEVVEGGAGSNASGGF